MAETRFTRLVGCSAPVQQAPMGPLAPPALVHAVARAGGLGTLHAFHTAADIESACAGLPGDVPGALAVNVLLSLLNQEMLEVAASRARVVDFFWGPPDAGLVKVAHAGGALAGWQVGSLDNARAAIDAGCDFIVAQGIEAGGHHDGRSELMPLLAACLEAFDVPVLAAGGIATAADVERVMRAGADGVRVGTRFLATNESNAHPAYQQALLDAGSGDAVETDRFTIGCPLCPSNHGVLRSSLTAATAREGEVVARFGPNEIRAFGGMPPLVGAEGQLDAMCMYAGRGVAGITSVQPVAEVVAELDGGAARAIA